MSDLTGLEQVIRRWRASWAKGSTPIPGADFTDLVRLCDLALEAIDKRELRKRIEGHLSSGSAVSAGSPRGEPVAWRYKNTPSSDWRHIGYPPAGVGPDAVVEPLYAASSGSPMARLERLHEIAEKYCGHSPTSSEPPELAIERYLASHVSESKK